MWRSFMKAKAFSRTMCALLLLLTVSGLADCGGNGSTGKLPPPPPPTITSISPNNAVVGGAAFTLTINGTNFIASSMVNFNGSAPATTFVNPAQVTAAIPASSIASTGTLIVTVTNPAPGGGNSNEMNFTVTSAVVSVPTINFISPSCAPAGEQFVDSVDNQMGVIGQNFVGDAVVRWNGSDRPTTFDSSQVLIAQISASDIAKAGTAAVTVFNPGAGGGSSSASTFTITPGAVDPQSIAVDPAGKFAYVASAGCDAQGYVSMYTINPTTGALTSVGPPVPTDEESTDSVTVHPSGKFAYVASYGNVFDCDNGSVATYTINAATGALTSIGAVGGENPNVCCFDSVTVDPSGKFAYVANGVGSDPTGVSMYTIDGTTGALTSIGIIAAGSNPSAVAVDPSGKFVYVANESGTSAGSVSMYTINATTGALTSTGTIAAGTDPVSVVVDPAGKFVYVANSASNDISIYTINATTGALTSVGTIAAGTNPVSVVVDPSGKFAYAVNFNSNDVSMYTIDATTGALTSTGTIASGQSPTSIAVHPSGNFAYVTNSASNEVSIYSIDAATGALALIGTIGT
jgi:6-phosphogluconolactonase (cycloisomerase 2 family)